MAKPAGRMLARLMLALLVAGCAVSPVDRLAKPPNLYSTGRNYQAERVPAAQRSVTPRLLYVTNRSQRLNGDGTVTYLSERSDSMGFGTAEVQFTRVADWPELVALTQAGGGRLPRLKVAGYQDSIRFSKTPLAAERRDGRVVTETQAERDYAAHAAAFRSAVAAEVRRAGDRAHPAVCAWLQQ